MPNGMATTGRTGGGSVVSLADYRSALHAAAFLRGALHEPAWLHGVVVEVAEDGAVCIVVLLTTNDPMVSLCIATAVNGVPVVQRVVG